MEVLWSFGPFGRVEPFPSLQRLFIQLHDDHNLEIAISLTPATLDIDNH